MVEQACSYMEAERGYQNVIENIIMLCSINFIIAAIIVDGIVDGITNMTFSALCSVIQFNQWIF